MHYGSRHCKVLSLLQLLWACCPSQLPVEPAAQLLLRSTLRHCQVLSLAGLLSSAAGFLAGFDKFMNLLLKDVEEDYTVMVQASLQLLCECSKVQVKHRRMKSALSQGLNI